MKTLKEKREDIFDIYDAPKDFQKFLINQDKECFKEILDEIEVAITSEKECMENDRYEEQEVEHLNRIEMANKIIKIIKQKSGYEE